MAAYRHIHIDYWQDSFVLDLTPEEKYFYMPILRYLRKNLNAKRFSEYVSNHLSTLKINKKITAL